MVENRKATQNKPPAMRRDSSTVGSKEKLKITTTRTAKNSMELKTSRERHSNRRSLAILTAVNFRRELLMLSPARRSCGRPALQRKGTGIHPLYPTASPIDG